MSELDRIELRGVVVDPGEDAPITDDQARQMIEGAFVLMREGNARLEQGKRLLQEAERRQVWRVLGFTSWDDCILDGISKHLRTTVEADARSALVIELRRSDALSTRTIAAAFQVSHSTIVRDLRLAREAGLIGDEPDRIQSSNGRMRKSHVQKTPRRIDLLKTWRTAVDDITRRTNTLASLCLDDRYRDRREDLTRATRGDLQRAHAILTSILDDFDKHQPDTADSSAHQNNGEN